MTTLNREDWNALVKSLEGGAGPEEMSRRAAAAAERLAAMGIESPHVTSLRTHLAAAEGERDAAKADADGWMKVYGKQIKLSADYALKLSAAEAERDRLKRAYDTDLAKASEITAAALARLDAAEADLRRSEERRALAEDHARGGWDEAASLRRSLEEARGLLGRWMFWASGVAFKSELGEQLVADTDKALATLSPEGKPETKETDRG